MADIISSKIELINLKASVHIHNGQNLERF